MNKRNLIISLLLWTSAGLHADVEILARFEPSRVALGNASMYVVEITHSDANVQSSINQIDTLPIPVISGITLRSRQTSSSQRAEITNGRAAYSITQRITFNAIPTSTGEFTIPSYVFNHKGMQISVPAATLTVVERSAQAGSNNDEQVFLNLKIPEKLYVGQTKLLNLQLYVAENLNLQGYSDFERNADAFTLLGGPPEKATQSVKIANGRRYKVYSWPLQMTPIRTGEQTLDFYFELSVNVPSQRNTRNNPLNQSIFDNFFGRTQRFSVYSKETQNILPLPTESQPENFSGAIGQFNMQVSADTQSTRINEPIMLSLKISGEGNFGRIHAPELQETDGWRNYPPESVFEADAANSLRGTKRFDYIFVPEKAGKLELPAVSFAFFDPDVEEYVELTSPALTVDVAPSNIPPAPVSRPPNAESPDKSSLTSDLTKSLSSEELLLTLDYRLKKGRKLMPGLGFTPFFYVLNSSFLIVLSVIAGMGYFRKRNLQDENYLFLKSAKQELKTTLKKANDCDLAELYGHAQTAVRLAASIRMKQNLRSADLTELEAHFQKLKHPEITLKNTRNLFHTADSFRFSGQALEIDRSEALAQLNSILKAL